MREFIYGRALLEFGSTSLFVSESICLFNYIIINKNIRVSIIELCCDEVGLLKGPFSVKILENGTSSAIMVNDVPN